MDAMKKWLYKEIRAAYIEGKSGKPCGIWPPLTREATRQEVARTAEEIAGELEAANEMAGIPKGVMVSALKGYMLAWQAGAGSDPP